MNKGWISHGFLFDLSGPRPVLLYHSVSDAEAIVTSPFSLFVYARGAAEDDGCFLLPVVNYRWCCVAGACVSRVLVVGKAPTEAAVFANDSAKII